MTRRTRFIILLICVALFFIIAPYIVLYSLGYRIDFENQEIVATGGIYVRAYPTGAAIKIDDGATNTTGFFNNSVFVQNLAPGIHQVSIAKEAYYDYEKKLLVRHNEVTKLENVTLFKKNIAFQVISDIPATATQSALTAKEQFDLLIKKPVEKLPTTIKNAVTFTLSGDTLLWLATNGLLYRSDAQGLNPQVSSKTALTISKKKIYKLESLASHIFLQEDRATSLLNPVTGEFEVFYDSIDGFELSSDSRKIAYYNSHELWYWLPGAEPSLQKVLLRKSKGIIKNVYWGNNDYLLFSDNSQIVISEIDVRGNINTITISGDYKNSQIYFNQNDKKLYVLSGGNLMVSERLVP